MWQAKGDRTCATPPNARDHRRLIGIFVGLFGFAMPRMTERNAEIGEVFASSRTRNSCGPIVLRAPPRDRRAGPWPAPRPLGGVLMLGAAGLFFWASVQRGHHVPDRFRALAPSRYSAGKPDDRRLISERQLVEASGPPPFITSTARLSTQKAPLSRMSAPDVASNQAPISSGRRRDPRCRSGSG